MNIKEIKAREQAATPGPWERSHNDPWIVGSKNIVYNFLRICEVDNANDADLIAHARTDIPALIAEVERLREEVKTGRHMFAPIQLSDNAAELFCNAMDVSRLEEDNAAKDQQIATLKKALELACAELNLSPVETVFASNYFVQQAQEQEKKHDK